MNSKSLFEEIDSFHCIATTSEEQMLCIHAACKRVEPCSTP